MQNNKLADLLHKYFELGVAEGREGRNHDTEGGDAQRVLSEIEAEIAALSSARPIGFTDSSELKNKERHGLFAHIGADTSWLNGPIALYAAPPAPSVAVKALEWSRTITTYGHLLKAYDPFGRQAYGIRVEDGTAKEDIAKAKAEKQADYEARIRSALSAQVQDDADTAAAIDLGAAVLSKISDPAAREIAIRNALIAASNRSPEPTVMYNGWVRNPTEQPYKFADTQSPDREQVQNVAGWHLVPTDATDKMIAAALDVDWSNENEIAAVHDIWHSMVAAAPQSRRANG